MKDALTRAGDHLLRVLSPEHHFIPFYEFHINEQLQAWAWLRGPTHNIGRWIDAMLRLEACTGYSIPPDIEAAMMANLRLCFDNPDNLFLFPMDADAFPADAALSLLEYHSMREGLLALTQMITRRDSSWARTKAAKMIDTVDRISDTRLEPWRVALLDRWQRLDQPGAPISRTVLDSGRFMEAGMDYVQATGNEQALALVGRFAEIHYELNTWPGGAYEVNWANYHTHSYLGMLKGLLQYGVVSGDRRFVDRVAETYANSVRLRVVRESGVAFHDGDKETGADPAAAGDSMQLALWLADAGRPEFLDDAGRLVRSRLLPSQVRDCPPLSNEQLPRDGENKPYFINQVSRTNRQATDSSIFHPKDMHKIVDGGWGINREAHWARQATTDVSCAVLHSLCDFYQRIVARTDASRRVDFHVDYEDDEMRIKVVDGERADVQIDNRSGKALEIRIPIWVPADGLTVSADGATIAAKPTDGIIACGPARQIRLAYDLPERVTEETVDRITYTFRWRGDRIVGIKPNNTAWLPMYPNF